MCYFQCGLGEAATIVYFLYSLVPKVPWLKDQWYKDPNSTKEYIILKINKDDDEEEDEYNYNDLKQRCSEEGAILPEPRNEEENHFLDSLGASTFFLGITYDNKDHMWSFASDHVNLTYESWAKFKTGISKYPSNREDHNCVVMVRGLRSGDDGHKTSDWINVPCDDPRDIVPRSVIKSIVCEKAEG